MVMHVDGMVKITIMGQTKILYLFIYWVCHSQSVEMSSCW